MKKIKPGIVKSKLDQEPSRGSVMKEMAVNALNEQGFLFSQIVFERIKYGDHRAGGSQSSWQIMEREYPVTASDEEQTRIDLVLANVTRPDFYLCLECKRANPAYKTWFFFDKESQDRCPIFIESFDVQMRPLNSESRVYHWIQPIEPSPCDVFKAYVEAGIKKNNGKASSTETIEKAFLQVMRGHTGLVAKAFNFESAFFFRSIPVVVTTAEMFEARYDSTKISLNDGFVDLDNLKLYPLEYCAVNYRPNDNLSIISQHVRQAKQSIEHDVRNWQTRTIFVVHAPKLLKFLEWLHAKFVKK